MKSDVDMRGVARTEGLVTSLSVDEAHSEEPVSAFGCRTQPGQISSLANLLQRGACCLAIVLMVILRLVYLDSDASPRLSWSSALLTDEGFYIHNARNLILYGRERTDGFNNMLLMPLLHLAQVAFFRITGVGAVQARLLTVLLSLCGLALFFFALRRAFGSRVAWIGLILLGLDPVYLMYNRLALMDSPACLPLCAAFYAWTCRTERARMPFCQIKGAQIALFMTGVFLALAYNIRGLAVITAAAPLSILGINWWKWWKQQHAVDISQQVSERGNGIHRSGILNFLAGMMLVLLIYGVTVWWPNRAELSHANQFYLQKQLVPHSLKTFNRNVVRAVSDPYRGILPFLCKHSPLLVLIVGVPWMALFGRAMKSQQQKNGGWRDISTRFKLLWHQLLWSDAWDDNVAYLVGWVAIFLVFVTVVSYSPSRYYVLFYPGLAGLAAISLDRLLFNTPDAMLRVIRGTQLLLVRIGVVIFWFVISSYWYVDWLGNLTYRQRDADLWLAEHLPPNAILIGAVAPGLCLNNKLRCVTMIGELCNDDHPVEHFSADPCYLAILDRNPDVPLTPVDVVKGGVGRTGPRADRWRERWWALHYPSLVDPGRRLHAFHPILRSFFTVGIYQVPATGGPFWRDVKKDDLLKNKSNNVN